MGLFDGLIDFGKRLIFDYCPKCDSDKVTKELVSKNFSAGYEVQNFMFKCQNCGHKWTDTKKTKVEVNVKA